MQTDTQRHEPSAIRPEIAHYNDRTFRFTASIVVAFFVTCYGSKDYLSLFLHPGFYLELLVTLLFTVLLVEGISYATRWLDKRYDWRRRPVERVMLQLFACVLLPGVVEFLLAGLYFRIFGVNILETTFLAYAFPLIMMLIVLFNVYYFAYYNYLLWKQAERRLGQQAAGSRDLPLQEEAPQFEVSFGATGLRLPFSEICYFYREDKYNYLMALTGEKYIVTQTLDEIEATLDPGMFFRVNRQAIVNFNCCQGYRDASYGKLEVVLNPPFPAGGPVIISQRKAPKFKGWIGKSGLRA